MRIEKDQDFLWLINPKAILNFHRNKILDYDSI